MRRRGVVWAVGLGLLAVMWAEPANACLPTSGVTSRVLPVAAKEQPANVAVVFQENCLFGAEVQFIASVDGALAELSELDLPLGSGGHAYRVEPTPAVGSQVAVFADPEFNEDTMGCRPPEPFAFVAGPADFIGPRAPSLSVSTAPDTQLEYTCMGPSESYDAVRLTLTVDPDPADDGPVSYAVELRHAHGVLERAGPAAASPQGGPVEFDLWASRSSFEADPTYCIVAHTFDAAGNEADDAEYCGQVDVDEVFGASCSVGERGGVPGWGVVVLLGFFRARARARARARSRTRPSARSASRRNKQSR